MPRFLANSTTLLLRLGIALFFFSLCRVLFFWFNSSYFSDVSLSLFWYGIRFDLVALCYVFTPFIILHQFPHPFRDRKAYKKTLKILFHVCNGICLLFNMIDLEYFKFTLKRTTADLFQLVGMGEDFSTLLPTYIASFWYLVIMFAAFIAITEFLYRKIPDRTYSPEGVKEYIFDSLTFVALVGLTIVGFRGGLQLKPLDIINAGQYAQAQNIPIVLNTPFTLIKTLDRKGLDELNFYTEEELKEIFDPVHEPRSNGDFRKKNVVVIVMESFSKEYIGGYNDYDGYTPVLDSIMKKSLVFDRCYANGRKSIEGIPSILAGLPTFMNHPYISSVYSGNQINSLANLLKAEGYATSFFHGASNGSMGFDGFANTAGFERYIGLNEYPDKADSDGNWGIFDEPFFEYFARELDKESKPFMAAFFSLSSHHPFKLPDGYEDKFASGSLKIHRSIRYSDYALGKFFELASQSDWFENTLFVITADHTSQTNQKEYANSVGWYAVPMIFYEPGSENPEVNHRVTQQTDIMPTVLDILNYPHPYVAFGQSAIHPKRAGYSLAYLNNIYQLITDKYVLQFDGSNAVALFNLETDPGLEENVLEVEAEIAKELEREIKAMVQSYNNRMINNQLTIPR